MPKAYWIAHVTVTDPEPYAIYAEGASQAFRKFGAACWRGVAPSSSSRAKAIRATW